MNTPPKQMERNPRIDLLRGWLMVLVITGHIVLGSVHENLIRYIIYAFHMPLFIGISGYLINIEKLRETGFASLVVRYWWRVLLPFALAYLFFTGTLTFHAYQEGRISSQLLLSYLHTPYYHLWFVPTLVLWVFGFWIARKLKLPLQWMLLLFIGLTAVWSAVPKNDLWPFLAMLLSKKVIYFFAFFLFGVWLNTRSSNKLLRIVANFKVLPAALVLICAVIYLMDIGHQKELAKGLAWLVMNLGLIAISVVWIVQYREAKPRSPGKLNRNLIAMGRISLPIYLWHMLPMFLLKGFDLHQDQVYLYYGVSVVSVAVILAVLIRLENKSLILNKLIYGA